MFLANYYPYYFNSKKSYGYIQVKTKMFELIDYTLDSWLKFEHRFYSDYYYNNHSLITAITDLYNIVIVSVITKELYYAASYLPGLTNIIHERPCGCETPRSGMLLGWIITHLNDDHKWSRNKIADWLDELADKGEINIDFPNPNEKD